ncbi:MAG TPA: serine/threonine-protein kinase, partial [Vicinamibacterales bacterium]|nr:serine/threonine-protein kinase [Vicinamibacterales bacterium]
MEPRPSDQWEPLLDAVLERPEADRQRFLAQACGGDAALLARLQRLLALAASGIGFLDRSPLAHPGTPAPAPHVLSAGQPFGPYRLVRPLGAGGMGEVWLAERVEGGVAQAVAIKCLRAESPSLLARFEAERAILAGLDHPGIARLHDGGLSPDGRPYMVMEYVQGEDLLTWCDRGNAGLGTRLAVFLDVCDAVAYAHTHLVVHRDLKPANILVTAAGTVKLLDFGIARLLQEEKAGDKTLTAHLSAAYAAPEQLTGAPVSTATDVHALGVTLYQLIAGQLPWMIADLPIGLAVQRLLTTEPIPPSRAARPGGPVPPRALRGDLDAIVARALRHEPEARYPDARALADDIRRHVRHEPVEARTGARAYVMRRFVRRHWLPVAAAAALFAALTVGATGIAWQARRAEEQAARATVIKDYLVRVFEASDPRIA